MSDLVPLKDELLSASSASLFEHVAYRSSTFTLFAASQSSVHTLCSQYMLKP